MAPSGGPAKQRVSRREARLTKATRCDAAFRLIASRCLVDIAANHHATCAGDEDALHQIRVAVTKLRAAVSFFGDMVMDSEWLRLKSELKWLNGFLGARRATWTWRSRSRLTSACCRPHGSTVITGCAKP